MADYLDVLVLCSDPVNLRRTLDLAQELVHFEQVIRRSELPIRLRRIFPPTLEQLRHEFSLAESQGRQPSVFHFLGHGDDDGLYFENEHGEAHLVKGHELQQALARSPVKVALLNACWSATKRDVSLCEFLTREQVADVAIGHERPVADVSAIEFARQFYSLITQGKTVRDACQRAANSLAEQGHSGASEVKLVGEGDFVFTAGLLSGSRPCVIESGLPRLGHLPEAGAFYGRGEELVQLSRSFADASLVGFGLWGIGGIGKTALAKMAARRNAWRYQGAVWVDIRDATQKTTAELLRLALCRLHPGAPDADPAFELTRRMQNAPSLVVLDNLEDLPEPEHAALARFLQHVPKNGSSVLLTARVPLAAIDRLPDVLSHRLTQGLDAWNGAYYVQHVAVQKQCQALRDELREEASKLEGLCVLVTRRLHGHPKMLELAVGVALRGRHALEQALATLPDDLEEQLAALLATSLQYLSDDGRRVLPLLSFFPTGSLTPEALDVAGRAVDAATVTLMEETDEAGNDSDSDGDSEPDLSWLTRGRDQLVSAGLLDYDQAHDIYTFHQAILKEAHRRHYSDDARSAATVALLGHFAEYVELNHNDNERLDRCIDTVLILMESLWAQREGKRAIDAILARMTGCLGTYFHQRGLWRLGQIWHDRAIEFHRSSSHGQSVAHLCVQLLQHGQVLLACGESDAALAAVNEAFRLYTEAENQQGIAAALHELAIIESNRGNLSEARHLLQRSLAVKELLNNQFDLAASLYELAKVEAGLGKPSEARHLLQRSLAIFEMLGDQQGLAASLFQLATIELDQGNPSEARRLLQRSLAILETLGDQRGLAVSLHTLATIESEQGNPSEARRLVQRSLAILESLGSQFELSTVLLKLATIELKSGNSNEARRLLQRTIEIDEALGNQRGLPASLYELARIELSQGNPTEARHLLKRSLAILEALGDQRGLAASLHQLANIEMTAGNRDAARRLWERSIRIKESIGNVAGVATTQINLAQLEAAEGRFTNAIELASEAVRQLEQLGYAKSEEARKVLREIEQLAARDKSASSPYAARLNQMISVWKSLSHSEQAARLTNSAIDPDDPAEGVLTWLAQGVMCWQQDDIAACETALAKGQTLAEASGNVELLALVIALREQLEAATFETSPSLSELPAALDLLKQGNLTAAVSLLEQALAQARVDDIPLAVATCQFYLGQVSRMSDRPADAVTALREALELALQVGDTELILAIQEVLTAATRDANIP